MPPGLTAPPLVPMLPRGNARLSAHINVAGNNEPKTGLQDRITSRRYHVTFVWRRVPALCALDLKKTIGCSPDSPNPGESRGIPAKSQQK